MALNWVQLESGRPIALPNETFVHQSEKVKLSLSIPPSLEGPKRTVNGLGSLFITNQRLVFVQDGSAIVTPGEPAVSSYALRTLAVPHTNVLSTAFNQPMFFGANSISMSFVSTPGGGLPSTGRNAHLDVTLDFAEGKVHEIWKTLEQARKKAGTAIADETWQRNQLRKI
ncbi:hypothetical protein FFLO_02981 [Filobasidium floriforme]|uniref:GRAM domain-containing protein n=1 Tax=Filobasidium floriforme TaxID=5210 RepID=A0A8K0JM17_9TREE|nr:hypothetical protein FFLO_02981 [Filobasidium floriforme]